MLLHGFAKVFTWICQIFLYFFAKQNQAEGWPRFQRLLKLLLWNKGVEWVKVGNALSPLCLWQCLTLSCAHCKGCIRGEECSNAEPLSDLCFVETCTHKSCSCSCHCHNLHWQVDRKKVNWSTNKDHRVALPGLDSFCTVTWKFDVRFLGLKKNWWSFNCASSDVEVPDIVGKD